MHDILYRAEQYQNLCIKKAQAHYLAAETFRTRHVLLGTPVTILSSIVATTIFATLAQSSRNQAVTAATGALSICAAILSGLQTFLHYADIAADHKRVGVLYEGLRRDLDLFALTYRASTNRDLAIKALTEIVANLDAADQSAPTIPNRIYKSITWKPASDEEFAPLDTHPQTPPAG